MVAPSRPSRGGRGGGGRSNGSSDSSRKKPPAPVLGSGNIFDSESPKAYSPLGYGVPERPQVLRPEDFNNDQPLPSCPIRPAQYILKPLGATFLDTESTKMNFQGVVDRKLVPRDNTKELDDKRFDPLVRLCQAKEKTKTPLTLGKTEVRETTLEVGTVHFDKYLKRERESTTEPEDGQNNKKMKRSNDFRIKFDGEEEADINDDTVKPENVLRMVDSSLVENTPEKKKDDDTGNNSSSEDEYRRHYSSSLAPGHSSHPPHHSHSQPPLRPPPPHPHHQALPPRYDDGYYRYHDRDRSRDRRDHHHRMRSRDYPPPPPHHRDGHYQSSYKYPGDDSYKIPPSSAPSRSHGALPPSSRYYDDYEYRQHYHNSRPSSMGSAASAPTYYDRYYDDKRYSRYHDHPPPPPPPPPPHPHAIPTSPDRRGPPPPPLHPREYDAYALPPPPPPPHPAGGIPPSSGGSYRDYDRGHVRTGSGPPPRRYDDRRRY